MITPERARDLTEQLRLYAQPQRLLILSLLLDGALPVSDIETRSGIRQPTLSQQLGELRRAGVLTTSRASRTVLYRFSDDLHRHRAQDLMRILDPSCQRQAGSTSPRPLENPTGGAVFAQVHSQRR
ncbi:ArsR family transcriptional regulator [Neoasaia chiangmaiensis NBRC 101099]|uniref:Uncharacterized protein n=1 Tax=Neoasaia chiangmaiensis TaxID=320497 RepID=A0A1U9KRX8_9PROT|nr:metalloregulator ArsR/SmtB family transcription factor [Neoasaia chiangmaiensis]AQS88593.1 hypothetical protein A0U93_12335 [Neoasaia chiangmaiensis]GBR36188.1 ArsR family transcriptional regulator [Neoasaia chiangmaiensis NBRC 101099]GEN15441.1 hypothetical protein NCH01_18720 [Neoasaia chiangmaiensis]